MTKRDILTPIGITLGFIMIALAIITNSGVEGATQFVDLASILIVIGGLNASLLINFKLEQMNVFLKVMLQAFRSNTPQLPRLIEQFMVLSEKARREGILALEQEIEEVDDEFFKKGMLLAVDGIEPEVIHDIMEAEISAMEERHARGRMILEKAGEYAPAWGMIGTLVGLVLMLNKLQDPATLGPSMAVALLTTLYGTVLANLAFVPMANKLENKTNEEVFMKQIIIEGVIGVQSGQNPRILEEKLSAFLSEEDEKEQERLEQARLAGDETNET